MLAFLETTISDVPCGGADVLRVIKFFMMLVRVVCTVISILLIVLIAIEFVKNIIAKNGDDMKKGLQMVVKKLVMCVGLFLVPTIVSVMVSILGSLSVDYANCIKISESDDLSSYEVNYPEVKNSKSSDLQTNKSTVIPSENSDDSSSSESGSSSSDNSSSSSDSGTSSSEESDDATNYNCRVYMGDSRFNGMANAVSGKDGKGVKWIYKSGKGYSWMVKDALPSLDKYLKKNSSYKCLIYINFGVNDMAKIDKYIPKYQEITQKYSGSHKVIIVSVNPINDKLMKNSYYSNKQVINFNNKLKKASGIHYCDTYSQYMTGNWSTSPDGLHYTNSTYKKIFDAINQCT